ncbi:MAG TPA: hypothetical protein VHQ93_12740 [Chitinophagaceae bacterium]|jgi:hypothetical protein|nr:hypothetical protein [Chitinophagaceae bacterium]
MKFWTSIQKHDDKIIAFANETIYKANPRVNDIDKYILDLKTQNISYPQFLGIPLHYVTQINQQENKKYIEVMFRGDTEHLKIENDNQRNEIFEFFKQNIPGANYTVIKQSKIQAIKAPLIAIAVILSIFLWSLFITIGSENGNEYDIAGERYHSFAGIALILASLGVTKLITIFGFLLLIACFSLYKKYKNPAIKNSLIIKR